MSVANKSRYLRRARPLFLCGVTERTIGSFKPALAGSVALRRDPFLPSSSLSERPCLRRHPPTRRSIHFLPLLGLWGAKHVTAWTLYNACKAYGWPNVYRRLLEQNRSANGASNPELERRVREVIRLAIEAPPKFAARLSEYADVIVPFLKGVAERAEPAMPRFLVVAAKYVVNSQKPVRIMQDLVGSATAAGGKAK